MPSSIVYLIFIHRSFGIFWLQNASMYILVIVHEDVYLEF